MKKEKNIISNERRADGLSPFFVDISNLGAKLLGKQGLMEMKLLTSWKNIVGDELSQYSMPERISFKKDMRTDGTLHLFVLSGAFAIEIGHKSPIILEKINTFFGYNAISQIKITQNESAFFDINDTKFEDNKDKKLVSSEQQNYIKQITEDIKNPELKKRLISLGINIFKNN